MAYISDTHEATLFIKEKAFFVIAGNFTKPCFFTPTETVGLIKRSDIDGFLEAVKKDTIRESARFENSQWCVERYKTIHVGHSRKGNMCVTSHMGLFLVVDIDFEEKDYFVKNGIKTLWPSVTQTLIDAQKLPRLNAHYRKLAKGSDEMIVTFIEEEKKKEEQAQRHKEMRAKNAKALADFLGTKNEDLYKSLMEYDFFYSYSDDHSVYRAGVNKEKELSALLVERGFDSKVVFSLVNKARS